MKRVKFENEQDIEQLHRMVQLLLSIFYPLVFHFAALGQLLQ
jgi:hypothetical protein